MWCYPFESFGCFCLLATDRSSENEASRNNNWWIELHDLGKHINLNIIQIAHIRIYLT